MLGTMAAVGVSAFLTGGKEPFNFRAPLPDSETTKPEAECDPIEYPKPDGVLSFDLLANLQRSGTNHDHDQVSPV